MKKRIITAIVAIILLIPFLVFSDTPLFVAFALVLATIGIYEMQGCIGTRKMLAVSIPSFAVTAAVTGFSRYVDESMFFEFMFALYMAYIVLVLSVSVFSKGKIDVESAAMAIVTTIYISFGFVSLVLLRDLPSGKYLYLLGLFVPWISDTFAYFIGMFFGKHKLIPDVSPKKTVEGAVGGIVFTALFVVLYGYLVGAHIDSNFTPSYIGLAAMGAAASVISQCGDLIASHIKRKYGVKDYGFILPGHGGILDRFDSILLTSPVIYFLCLFFSVIHY